MGLGLAGAANIYCLAIASAAGCTCDPSLHPSRVARCHIDEGGLHVMTLDAAAGSTWSEQRNWRGGHNCGLLPGMRCSCCDCGVVRSANSTPTSAFAAAGAPPLPLPPSLHAPSDDDRAAPAPVPPPEEILKEAVSPGCSCDPATQVRRLTVTDRNCDRHLLMTLVAV